VRRRVPAPQPARGRRVRGAAMGHFVPIRRRGAPTLGSRPRATGSRGLRHTVIGVAVIAIMLFPLYWMVNVSLQPAGNAAATPWLPFDFSLRGYETAIAEQGGNLVTSLVVSLGAVVLSLTVAAPAAYALAHFRFGRWVSVILFAVLTTQMVPGIVVANALYSAYSDLGLLNTYAGLILADSAAGIPFSIILIRAFMMG